MREWLIKLYWFFWECIAKVTKNPTLMPPPSYYNLFRAKEVYDDAFLRCFEFLKKNYVRGEIVEFGTFNGYTARLLAKNIRRFHMSFPLHLFGSFEGLPEISSKPDLDCYEVKDLRVWCKASMTALPGAEKNIFRALLKFLPKERLKIHKGFFADTLLKSHFKNKLALVHVDCDLYQSAYDVLIRLVEWKLLLDGSILLCDDYNSSRGNPNFGEGKAIAEVFNEHAGYSLSHFITYGWHGAGFIVHDKSVK